MTAGPSAPLPTRFAPPGSVDDLQDEVHRRAWSDWVSAGINEARERDGREAGLRGAGPRPQFFNPLRAWPGEELVRREVAWCAFPRRVAAAAASDQERWRRADGSRDLQDE